MFDPIPNRNGGRVDIRRNDADRQFKRKWYSSQRWKRFRLIKLARNPMCERKGCPNLSEHVHHIHDDPALWTWNLEDYESLCESCHGKETQARM